MGDVEQGRRTESSWDIWNQCSWDWAFTLAWEIILYVSWESRPIYYGNLILQSRKGRMSSQKRLWRRVWIQFEEQKVSESSFWCLPWWECGSSRTEGSSLADPPNPTLFPTFTFSPQQREPLPLPHPPLQSRLPGPSQCAAQSGRGLVGWWLGGWGTPLGWWLRHFSHSLAEETWTWAWTHPSDTALCSISAADMM